MLQFSSGADITSYYGVHKSMHAASCAAERSAAREQSLESRRAQQEQLAAAAARQRWRDLVIETDPGIIIGYNICNSNLPYLMKRAKTFKVHDSPYWVRNRKMWLRMRDAHFSSKKLATRRPAAASLSTASKNAYLPQRLVDKLMYMYNYIEMARVTGIPMSFLLTRVQSIKVFSQILRKARQKNLLVPNQPRKGLAHQGVSGDGVV
ncbi:hypothetical protein WJX75_000291 [Coccomyxa subellipsoidea]|uniref:DNA polymerase delta catalytic subunit n=1 Tax=Coccomyxa subellipsoidea TaxID=248742 RepID=A0ABR2YX52_9CHLO